MARKITKSILILIAFTCFILSAGAFFTVKPKNGFADDSQTQNVADFFSPATATEYFKTTNAKYVDETENYIAFVARVNNESNSSITVYDKLNNEYTVISDLYGISDGQIQFARIADKDYLLFQADLKLKALDLTTFNYHSIKNIVPNNNENEVITSYNFCYNGNYLAVAHNEGIVTYSPEVKDGEIFLRSRFVYVSSDSSPTANAFVTLNSDGIMYYAIGEKVYCDDVNATIINGEANIQSFTYEHSITYLLADANRLYFISDNDVGYFTLNQNYDPTVAIDGNSSEVLGNLNSPKSLSIFNDELLIVDNTKSTVQKFDVKDFNFTGYAIATTESSPNRIDKDSKHVSLYDGKLASLSNKELSLIDVKTGKYIKTQIENFTPEMLALGKDSVVIASASVIKVYAVESSTLTLKNTLNNENLKSCDYSCGKYYFYTSEANGSVHVYDEALILSGSVDKTVFATGLEDYVAGASRMDVDVDGNVNIFSTNNNYVVNIPASADLTKIKEKKLEHPSLRLESDLDGKVYSLSDGNVIECIDFSLEEPTLTKTTFTLHENLKKEYTGITNQNAISMALNFDSKAVYFILDGQSVILSCDTLNNRAITAIEGATEAKNSFYGEVGLKEVQKVNVQGKNAYEVTVNDSNVFNYVKRFVATESEYLIIGEFTDGYTLLLDEEKLVLLKTKDLPNETIAGVTASTKTVLFVSSSVNLYYYPVLSIDNTYCVYKSDSASPVRFQVGQPLLVEGQIDLNDKTFYYISTTLNGEEVKGYVPSKFVKETIDEADPLTTITYATVSADTDVLAEDRGSVIYTFTNSTKVRVLGGTTQYTLIEFTIDGTLYRGYVKSDALINTPNNAVRNAIIIILISLAILATSIYVINKKKTYVDASTTENGSKI